MKVNRLVGLALAGALLVAACGDDSNDDATAATTIGTSGSGATNAAGTTTPTNIDPNGTLRIAADFTSAGGLKLDPALVINPVYIGPLYLVYGTPIRLGVEPGTYRPDLAESYSVVDPTTFKMTLRAGLKYHDGQSYNAASFKAGVLREKDPKYTALNQAWLSKITDIQTTGETELLFKFSDPVAGLAPNVFSRLEGMIPAPNSDPVTKPVGAGPYTFESYDQTTYTVKKWPGYHNADAYKLATIQYLQVTPGQPALDALQAGQVDLASISPTSVKTLEGGGQFAVMQNKIEAFYYMAFCASVAPNDNLKFRQAVQATIDRAAINDTAQGGLGVLQSSLWPKGDAKAVAAYDNEKPDIAKAKQLLTEAGLTNPSATIVVQGNQPVQVQIAEIIQGQLANAGIKLSIVQSTNIATDFNNGTNVKGGFGETINTQSGVSKINFLPGLLSSRIQNSCQFNTPELNSIVSQLGALAPDDPKAAGLWQQAQTIIHDQALVIPLFTQAAAFGYPKAKVGGIKPGVSTLTVTSVANTFLDGVYIIKK